jgi:hypothetical protein
VISSTALLTAGPMRSMWVCWPGTPGRLRTERFSWQTNLEFRDDAEKHVASSFRFPLPASPRITQPTIVADSSKSRYRKECRRALARESNPQVRYRPGGTFLRFNRTFGDESRPLSAGSQPSGPRHKLLPPL